MVEVSLAGEGGGRREEGGILCKVSYEQAPPRDPFPYPSVYHFEKRVPLSHVS